MVSQGFMCSTVHIVGRQRIYSDKSPVYCRQSPTIMLLSWQSRVFNWPKRACLWTMEGDHECSEKPMQTYGEHAKRSLVWQGFTRLPCHHIQHTNILASENHQRRIILSFLEITRSKEGRMIRILKMGFISRAGSYLWQNRWKKTKARCCLKYSHNASMIIQHVIQEKTTSHLCPPLSHLPRKNKQISNQAGQLTSAHDGVEKQHANFMWQPDLMCCMYFTVHF